MQKIDTKELVELLSPKFSFNQKKRFLFKADPKFISPESVPKIYAYSAEGISIRTNIPYYNGEVFDFCGQTVNCILGQNDPWVTANLAVFILSNRPSFLSPAMGQEVFLTLPKRLLSVTKMGDNSFVNHRLNNGSDAVDLAVNMAYNHAQSKKKKLIAFYGSYHGQGHLPYGVSQLQQHLRFFSKVKVSFLEAPSHTENIDEPEKLPTHDIKILTKLRKIKKDVFAVIIEPVQFNNNGNTPSRIFMKALREECNRLKLTLIFDEVQTGWGWLGTMTAAEKYSVWPDIMVLSKSLTAGYGPLSVVIATEKFRNSGVVGSRTNGADARSLIAAHAVMDRLLGAKEIPAKVKNTDLGQELQRELLVDFECKHSLLLKFINNLKQEVNSHEGNIYIGAIKGLGLARMVEIKNKKKQFDSELTKKLQRQLLTKGGVFVRVPNNQKDVHTLFIKMPIVATEEDLSEGFERMKKIMINFKNSH